jgi:membrane carboxypeptidase/penicillin-binding protein
MAKALQGVPERQRPMPDRIVVVNINPATGTRAAQGGIPEYFYEENPPGDTPTVLGGGEAPGKASEEVKDQLF